MSFKKIGRFLFEAATWNDEDYFLQAVKNGDAYQVQRLLKAGKNVDLETRYSDGFTPLMAAVKNGHLGVAEILLEHGAKVDARDNKGETALHGAIMTRNPAAVQVLLSCGANTTIRDRHGITSHLLAAFLGSEDIFATLGSASAESEPQLRLILIAASGRIQGLDEMLKRVDPNAGVAGFTALLAACYNNQIETAAVLLERGADVNAKTRNSRTALMFAAMKGNQLLLQLLLRNGATPGVRDVDGSSARDWAAENGHTEAVALLDTQLARGDSAARSGRGGT